MITLRRYPITFNTTSVDVGGFKETVRPSAVDRALRTNADVVSLRNHDSTLTLGRVSAGTLRLTKDAYGLLAEVEADEEISYVGDLVRLIDRGDARGGSFGFVAIDDAWSLVDDEPYRELFDMHLREVSLGVSFPAYPSTARDNHSPSQIIRDIRPMSISMAEKFVRQWQTGR